MKKFAILFAVFFFFSGVRTAFGGAAVAAQQRKHATMQQMERQRKLVDNSYINPNAAEQPWYEPAPYIPKPEELPQKPPPAYPVTEKKAPRQAYSTPSVKSRAPSTATKVLTTDQMNQQEALQQAPQLPKEDLDRLVQIFDQTSVNWMKIPNPNVRIALVEQYITFYRENQIYIKRPATHYAAFIDTIAQESPEILKDPLDRVLMFVAILEYDFNNGENKDQLAKRILGDTLYHSNRKRLGIEQN